MPALVATSSLELGIDMGAVDLVVLVESPTSVASGLQRVGSRRAPGRRAVEGHRSSRSSAATCSRPRSSSSGCTTGAIETTVMPRNPLDVLAQQLVAMAVMDRWTVAELLEIVTRAAPFETLSREALEAVLGMLAGAYPSDEFAELKARVVWDRVTDVVEGRRDARVVAVTSGGTIPDRGLFGVFLAGEAGTPGRRVGELDEEMVYELRAGMHGDVVVLGRQQLAGARHHAGPGDRRAGAGRPGQAAVLEGRRGRAAGGAGPGDRRASCARPRPSWRAARRASARSRRGSASDHDLDELAARNLVAYLDEEREVAGALPTDRRLVVERFRDELGDWRLVILSPFGGRVHAPLTLAIETRLRERLGIEAQTIWSDDGIAVRLPEGEGDGDARRLAEIEALLFPAAGRGRGPGRRGGRRVGAVRVALPRERGPGAAPAAPPARRADAALAAAPARRGPAPGRVALRQLPDPRRDVPRVPVGRVRPRRAARGPRRHRAAGDRGPRRRDGRRPRRSRRRSCSTTWPRTCTRATRRSPSAGPARWRSIATCCASCSARRSSASCSIPRRSRTSSCRSSR